MVIMLVHGQLIIHVIQVLFICPFFLQVRVWVIKPTNHGCGNQSTNRCEELTEVSNHYNNFMVFQWVCLVFLEYFHIL